MSANGCGKCPWCGSDDTQWYTDKCVYEEACDCGWYYYEDSLRTLTADTSTQEGQDKKRELERELEEDVIYPDEPDEPERELEEDVIYPDELDEPDKVSDK